MDYLNISLEATDGNSYSLNDFKGKKLVVFFYPKDNTPGCTIENKDFSCLADEFKKENTQLIGISRDPIKSHLRFIEKQELNLLLLSDPQELLCNAMGVMKEKMMFGNKTFGIERSTFVFDENLNLVKEERKVKVDGHAQSILEFIKTMK